MGYKHLHIRIIETDYDIVRSIAVERGESVATVARSMIRRAVQRLREPVIAESDHRQIAAIGDPKISRR